MYTPFAVFPCVLLYFIPMWTAVHSHLCIVCASKYGGASTLGHQFALLYFYPITSVSMRTAITMVSCALFSSKSLNTAVSAHLYVVHWWYSCSSVICFHFHCVFVHREAMFYSSKCVLCCSSWGLCRAAQRHPSAFLWITSFYTAAVAHPFLQGCCCFLL